MAGSLYESRLEGALVLAKLPLQRFLSLPLKALPKLVQRHLQPCEIRTENTWSLSLSLVGLRILSSIGDGNKRENRCWYREGLGESKAVYTGL